MTNLFIDTDTRRKFIAFKPDLRGCCPCSFYLLMDKGVDLVRSDTGNDFFPVAVREYLPRYDQKFSFVRSLVGILM